MVVSCGNSRIHVSATAIVAAPPTTIAAGAPYHAAVTPDSNSPS